MSFLVATTSLPAVYRPNDDCWNTARSCQYIWSGGLVVGWPAGFVRKYNHFVAQFASEDLQELKLSLTSKLGPTVAI